MITGKQRWKQNERRKRMKERKGKKKKRNRRYIQSYKTVLAMDTSILGFFSLYFCFIVAAKK